MSRPRWMWGSLGPRLFDADGREYRQVDDLERVEVERLLTLNELSAVRIECGGGVAEWVPPNEARRLWLDIEGDLIDVEPWRPPFGAPGSQQYEAQLWRADDGTHVLLFTSE